MLDSTDAKGGIFVEALKFSYLCLEACLLCIDKELDRKPSSANRQALEEEIFSFNTK